MSIVANIQRHFALEIARASLTKEETKRIDAMFSAKNFKGLEAFIKDKTNSPEAIQYATVALEDLDHAMHSYKYDVRT